MIFLENTRFLGIMALVTLAVAIAIIVEILVNPNILLNIPTYVGISLHVLYPIVFVCLYILARRDKRKNGGM